MMSTEARIITHSALGPFRGVHFSDSQSLQLRGIKFGQIPGRWQDPILVDAPLGDGKPYDATKFGPACPQHIGGRAFDLELLGDILPAQVEQTSDQSELECLNLVVTVPAGWEQRTVSGEKLPVMVWIHGGGFSVGSNSWPHYDLKNFVALSSGMEKPVIGISINYRLGVFGFLASEELGISGNFGLKDQACAFRWIEKHISGFGGDPTNVTAFGESAGAISISTLLLASREPLFSRAIMMSGDTTLRKIRRMDWQNAHYEKNVSMLGLEGLSVEQRVKALKTKKSNDFIATMPMFQHWSPTVDGHYIMAQVDLSTLADCKQSSGKPSWCEEIIVGDSAQDGTIFKSRLLDDPDAMKRVHQAVSRLFDEEGARCILQPYKLTTTASSDVQCRGILQLVSDVRFYLPVLKVAEGWKTEREGKCHVYHFHQPNPLRGPWRGLASHELDVAFLLQNLNAYFPAQSIKLSQKMAEIWIDFAYKRGWSSDSKALRVLVLGSENSTSIVTERHYDEEYRGGAGMLMENLGWRKCFALGEMLQGCYDETDDIAPNL